MAELGIEALTARAGDHLLVDDVTLRVGAGELVALVGPNGAGKSSLLRAIAGVLVHEGAVRFDGAALGAMPPQDRARLLSWLPQAHPPAWPVKVRDAVAIGRYAWGGGLLGGDDAAVVEQILARCDLTAFADRRITSLSGGELARVHLARALVAQAPLLLADEPVAALDPAHRLTVMQILRDHADGGGTVLVVLHDIGLAARYCDRIIGVRDGQVKAEGAPASVVTAAFMAALFDVAADIQMVGGVPVPVVTAPSAAPAG
jgi:iron complex transport system ATP-binding protein